MFGPFLIQEPAMTQPGKTFPASSKPSFPVVLLGIDADGKPKAARFHEKHAGLATKAASQLQLQVLTKRALGSAWL
jgi:hypothetical protein